MPIPDQITIDLDATELDKASGACVARIRIRRDDGKVATFHIRAGVVGGKARLDVKKLGREAANDSHKTVSGTWLEPLV